MTDWMQRLGKWRTVLTGWQLGTRPKGDPESDAVRDHREATLMLRADVNTLTLLLVKKGVITEVEYRAMMQIECEQMCKDLRKRFPGFKDADHGLDIDPTIAKDTTAGWKP